MLAVEYGGGPAYWGLPDPADEATVSTAMAMILERTTR
jgi:hypothetical protein